MFIHSKKLIISVLFTTPLFGMVPLTGIEQFKEQFHKYLEIARTCNPKNIRTIPAEHLKQHPKEFLGETLHCPNIKEEIIPIYDEIIDPNGKNKFANHYNNIVRKEKNSVKNHFFEKVMYRQ